MLKDARRGYWKVALVRKRLIALKAFVLVGACHSALAYASVSMPAHVKGEIRTISGEASDVALGLALGFFFGVSIPRARCDSLRAPLTNGKVL